MEHRISSPYHPQTNGLDERMNQTLVHTLIKMANSEDQWDKNIDVALYVYRISMQDSTRFSPFYLLYNRHPRNAIQHAVDSSTVEPTSMSDDENMTVEEVTAAWKEQTIVTHVGGNTDININQVKLLYIVSTQQILPREYLCLHYGAKTWLFKILYV